MRKKRISNQLVPRFGSRPGKARLKSGAEDLDLAIDLYIRHMHIANHKPTTIKWARDTLGHFKRYLSKQGYPITTALIQAEHLEEYILHCKSKNAETTVANKIGQIKRFFGFLAEHGYISCNISESLPRIKPSEPQITPLTRDQLRKLFAAPNLNTYTGIRDFTIMYLLLHSGARVSELLQRDIGDLTLENGTPVGIRLFNTKNRRGRIAFINGEARAVMAYYLRIRKKIFGSQVPYLFPTVDYTRLSRHTFWERMRKYGEKAGLTEIRCSPHTLRHTFAKEFLKNGGDSLILQDILGHSTTDMVRRYAKLFRTELQEKHAKFTPTKGLHLNIDFPSV
ncbi:MAG: tyrosine-type recombinase/integrase [Peptococcaceae bacterium]|nr:tyrosine-type recombinase/integrase [Peptococcaceae bacterium]